ncbi:hypothetical protein EDC30_101330 [Paucimonas lemoignei]|uniref:Lipoprotein n=1 Tax=Paucimonas lemoignei TaxID=29443 RepID=A0A4R3I2C2_PAULE|nr:hypothetical protein [Paucimonas lemoignei]TCS39374.1 hypothetical protein EDC30_101330 [Paucimonas lemoignei]
MKSMRINISTFVAAALLPVAAFAADSAKTAGSAGAALQPPVLSPLVIIAPTEMRTEPALTRGCWARLFQLPQFRGQNDLTIAGPMEIADLHTPVGVDWKPRMRSILVGPNASLTIYEGARFADKEATFKAGARVSDVRKELPGVMAINSLKITCIREIKGN